MKFLNHTLAATLGASVAAIAIYQSARPAVDTVTPAPVVRSAPVSVAATETDAGGEERARLARENAELRARLEIAHADLIQQDTQLTHVQAQLAELRRPLVADVLSSTLRAEMKSGEVVVTGGYPLPDGRRLYAFAKPSLEKVDGADGVMIRGHYILLTDEVGKVVGLDNLATNAANTLQHGEVWLAAEEEAVFAKLKNTPGADVVVYPSLFVQPGASGKIQVGDVQLQVTPSLAESEGGLAVELRLEQPLPTAGVVTPK